MVVESIKVWTDGSFNRSIPDLCRGGYLVLVNDSVIMAVGHVTSHKPEYASRWNVGGEVIAAGIGLSVAEAVRAVLVKQFGEDDVTREITLYHDYEGLNNWVRPNPKTGKRWKANNSVSREYVKLVDDVESHNIVLKFKWVKGHSGDKYNELVDQLAKGNWPAEIDYTKCQRKEIEI